MTDQIKLLALLQEQFKREARLDLLRFTQYTMPKYQVNWHHRLMCEKLNEFVYGKNKRLMIFVPPRHGKSELVSRRLPSFLLGRNPTLSIISASYSADLASRMNRDVQRIIDSDVYRHLFPETQLNGKNIRSVAIGSWLRNSDIFEIVGHGGVYKSAGVGGGITGMGSDIGIIDDPIKNEQEANSKVYRDKLEEWYNSTFYTRLEKEANILLTVTRWHEDDLAGRLLAKAKKDPEADQWEVFMLPAVNEIRSAQDPREIGQPLWPEKYSQVRLKAIKHTIGSQAFSALYQQNPTPAEGTLLKREFWKKYKERPTRFEMVILSVDCSFKETKDGSYVVVLALGKAGADYYLLDLERDRLDFVGTIARIRVVNGRLPRAKPILVEDKANGPAVISVLKTEISGVLAIEPNGSKESRAVSITPLLEAGNFYLPEGEPWVADFIEECAAFPKGQNDDQVDVLTQGVNYLQEFGKPSFFPGLVDLFGGDAWVEGDYFDVKGKKAIFCGLFFENESGCIVGIDEVGKICVVASLSGSQSRDALKKIKAIVGEMEALFYLREKCWYSETLAEIMENEEWTVELIKQYPSDIDTAFCELRDSKELTYPRSGMLFDHMSLLRTENEKDGVIFGAPKGLSCTAAWALSLANQCFEKNKEDLDSTVGLVDPIGYYTRLLED